MGEGSRQPAPSRRAFGRGRLGRAFDGVSVSVGPQGRRADTRHRGFVAADALHQMLELNRKSPGRPAFPLVKGLLTFDTPFCGLSRLMFAYGAFTQYQTATTAYGLLTSLSAAAIPSRASRPSSGRPFSKGAAWRPWQLLALKTGSAGAIATAGAMAYMYRHEISHGWSNLTMESIKKNLNSVSYENIERGLGYISQENLGSGWSWLSGHLQFVSALTRGVEMKDRIERLSHLQGLGFANFYVSLGPNSMWTGGRFVAERSFCAIPTPTVQAHRFYLKETNGRAKDEIQGHVSIFRPERNAGYDELGQRAAGLISSWQQTYTGVIKDEWKPRERAPEGRPPSAGKTDQDKVHYYTYGPKSGLQETPRDVTVKRSWLAPRDGYTNLTKTMSGLWPRKNVPSEDAAEDAADDVFPGLTRYYCDPSKGTCRTDKDSLVEREQPATDDEAGSMGLDDSESQGEGDEGQTKMEQPVLPGVTDDLGLEECETPATSSV